MRTFKAVVIIEDNEAKEESVEVIRNAQLDLLNDIGPDFDLKYKFESFEEIQPKS